MKLVKKINNNFALALDSKGEQIIVEGKGIGFLKMPCDFQDLKQITRTYYGTTAQYEALIKSVSPEVIEIAGTVTDYAKRFIPGTLNQNLPLILADHLQFALERMKKNIYLKTPLYYEIEHLYPKEAAIAEYGVKLIRKKLGVRLPEEEKTGIALTIINSEMEHSNKKNVNEQLIEECTEIVEEKMCIHISKDSFNYSRFVSHLQYLLRRAREPINSTSDNREMYQVISRKYADISECAEAIKNYLEPKGYYLNEEEKLYLILHIHRLCDREDCYQ